MNLEEEVEILLNGEGLDLKVFDYAPMELSPVTIRKTVCYIVSAIIFNDKNEVLMVQEAKQECYKQWYLPAGRMEENESIVDAMQREVKEEAGFDCQPITLLLVQEQGPQWIRYVFLAKITGGTLKTPAQADAESLQAQWWDQESPLALRGRDIIRLIESGRKYQQAAWHPLTLPLDMPCHVVAQRSIIAFSNSTGGLWILVTTLPRPHLPVAVAIKTHTVTWAASMAAQEALPSTYYDYDVNTLGVLSLQHSCMEQGKTDGVCFNMLVSLLPDVGGRREDGEKKKGTAEPPPTESLRYKWYKVDTETLKEKLLDRLKNMSVVPVHSLY